MLGAFRGDFEGVLEAAAGLNREEVRAAVECAPEVWPFGPAAKPQLRSYPSCGEGRPCLGFGRHGPFAGPRGTVPMAMEANEITPERARAARLAAQGGDASGIGMTIIAGFGRHGPWLKHGAD